LHRPDFQKTRLAAGLQCQALQQGTTLLRPTTLEQFLE
jgi:hypothetical protein